MKLSNVAPVMYDLSSQTGKNASLSSKRDLRPELCDTGSVSEFLGVISCFFLFCVSKTTMIPLISCFNPLLKFMSFPHNVRRAVDVYWSLNKTISKVLIRNFHTNSPNCNGITPFSELSTFGTAMARATCKPSHKRLILLRTNQSLVINRPNLINTI